LTSKRKYKKNLRLLISNSRTISFMKMYHISKGIKYFQLIILTSVLKSLESNNQRNYSLKKTQ